MHHLSSGAASAWRQQKTMLLLPWRKLAHLAQAVALVAAAFLLGAALWRLADRTTRSSRRVQVHSADEEVRESKALVREVEEDQNKFRWVRTEEYIKCVGNSFCARNCLTVIIRFSLQNTKNAKNI